MSRWSVSNSASSSRALGKRSRSARLPACKPRRIRWRSVSAIWSRRSAFLSVLGTVSMRLLNIYVVEHPCTSSVTQQMCRWSRFACLAKLRRQQSKPASRREHAFRTEECVATPAVVEVGELVKIHQDARRQRLSNSGVRRRAGSSSGCLALGEPSSCCRRCSRHATMMMTTA